MLKIEDLRALLRKCFWFSALRRLVKHQEEELFIVGGALRDIFLGKPVKDVDIAFSSLSCDLPLRFASEINGKVVFLGRDTPFYRVVKSPFTFDFSRLQGSWIVEDLSKRDFRMNSMGIDLKNGEFFDPLGGMKDLEDSKIRANSLSSLSNDRIRVLRAFRFRATLGFEIDAYTKLLIASLGRFSPWRFSSRERIADEWRKLLRGENFYFAVKDMVETGYLESLFTPFIYMKGMPQSSHHHLDVLGHSIKTVEALEDLLNSPPSWVKANYLSSQVGKFKVKHLLKFSALFHDIGKPFCFRRVDGEITFKGHQFVGAKISAGVAKALLFNKREIRFVRKLVFNHMMPLLFLKRKKFGRPWERSLISWLIRVEEDAIGIFFLSLADLRATRGEKVSDEERRLLFEIAEIGAKHLDRILKVKPVLSGRDIMRVKKLKPGPLVGTIKERLIHLQKLGNIKDKSDALRLILGDNIKGCRKR